jgi:hypothetical protein
MIGRLIAVLRRQVTSQELRLLMLCFGEREAAIRAGLILQGKRYEVTPCCLSALSHISHFLRRTWREALSCSVWIDSHIYRFRLGLISHRH